MIIVNNGPNVPKGMCGVYLLEIIDVRVTPHPKDGKHGFIFEYKVSDHEHPECKDTLTDTFYLGIEAWKLNKVLKCIRLNRKKSAIASTTIVGKKLWAAIRDNTVINEDSEVIDSYSSIFEYHVIGPGGHRPIYLGDPLLNDGVPMRKFVNVIQREGIIALVENAEEDDDEF